MFHHKSPLLLFLLGLVLLGLGPFSQPAQAKESGRVTLSIPVAQLPREGREVLAQIKKGGSGYNVKTSGGYYYTDDHYQTFRRIKE